MKHLSIIPDETKRESSLVAAEAIRANMVLRDLTTALFRWKWMVFGCFFIIAAITTAVALLLPNQYESRMKILVKNSRADVVITPERTNSTYNANDVTETEINSEIELLNSKDLLEQVVRQSGTAVESSSWLSDSSVPPVERSVRQLEKDLSIKPVTKANIIEVSYTAKSPDVAATVLQNLSSLYLEKHLRLHRPPGTTEFFQSQANQYGEQLREAEAKLAAFRQQTNFVSLDQEKQLNLQKMADAQSRYLEAGAAVNEATERIGRLQQQLGTLAPRVTTLSRTMPNQYSVERLSTMLAELQNRRTQLLTKFQPDDRLVKEVDQQIHDTTSALDKATKFTAIEQASDLNPLRQTLEAELARARLEQIGQQARHIDIAKQVAEYKGALARLEHATTENTDLERQVKETEGNYQLYAKKREEARIADALDQQKITNVSIAEAPTVQRLPVKPNRPLTLALGLLLAAFVSVGSAIGAEYLRDTVHNAHELESLTSVPVIATVPNYKLPGSRREVIAGHEAENGDAVDTPESAEMLRRRLTPADDAMN
jgi:uncharacterized protein involved in exopolysaccharide biosynthesis